MTTQRTEDHGEEMGEILRRAGTHPIVENFPEGAIVVFDRELRYLCAGGQGLSLVGLTRESMEGRTIFEIFSPEVAAALEQPYFRVLEGHDQTVDIRVGGRAFIHRVAPLADQEGAIVAGVGFTLDVTESYHAEEALRASETKLTVERRRLRDAEIVGHSGSWEWDIASGVITWSDGLFALHGLDPQHFPGGYAEASSRVHPRDRALVDAAMESCRRDEPAQFRYRVIRAADDELRWFDSRASGVFEDGVLVRLMGAVADVTDEVNAQAQVIDTNTFLEAVLTASPDFTFITDLATGAVVYGSRDLLGFSNTFIESLGAEAIGTLVHPDDQAELRVLNSQVRHLEEGAVRHIRYRLLHADGDWHWFSRHVVPFRRDEEGNVTEVLGVLRDITDVVMVEERLAHAALHDALTGLPNRALLLDRLETALVRSLREQREIAVFYCDLDGFKRVNDTAGHAAGDAVLTEAASRLVGVLRDGDTVARVGGDEFVLVVEPWNRPVADQSHHADRDGGAERSFSLEVADRVIRTIAEPFVVDGTRHEVTVSIGVNLLSPVSLTPSGEMLAIRAIEGADGAMYVAKHRGKNRVHVAIADSSWE
jgi:diguanylate cyclase (GGDEF)-like protein/PAS domain S-box-containing protein